MGNTSVTLLVLQLERGVYRIFTARWLWVAKSGALVRSRNVGHHSFVGLYTTLTTAVKLDDGTTTRVTRSIAGPRHPPIV